MSNALPAQAATIARLGDEWGDTFITTDTAADGSVTIRRASDHEYYEPSPVRYRVAADGIAVEIDRDGYEIEAA